MTERRSRLTKSFERHYQDLLRFLFHRTRDINDAADLAHDTYVRLAKAADVVVENEKAYIFRVVGNLALDMHRRAGRRATWLANEEPDENISDQTPSQEQHAIDRDRLARLDAALVELPVRVRLAFLMLRVDGLSYVEIGARLGVSESMVAKYIVQAMRHCRDHIKQGEE